MKGKLSLALATCVFTMLFTAQQGHADRRRYVWTYEYMTMWKGTAEIEYYLTAEFPDTGEAEINAWKHWLEIEYGITDRWDVSMYQQFKQTNTPEKSEFKYDGFKLRTRYRIWDKGRLPLDMLLYLEYIRDADFSKPNILEGKLVLARDIGRFNLAYNQVVKQELESGGKTEIEYAVGSSYSIHNIFKLGIESKGNFTEGEYAIGPTLSLSAGKLWFALSTLAGLNGKSDDVAARLIIGYPF
jgi:hypothetical protein